MLGGAALDWKLQYPSTGDYVRGWIRLHRTGERTESWRLGHGLPEANCPQGASDEMMASTRPLSWGRFLPLGNPCPKRSASCRLAL